MILNILGILRAAVYTRITKHDWRCACVAREISLLYEGDQPLVKQSPSCTVDPTGYDPYPTACCRLAPDIRTAIIQV